MTLNDDAWEETFSRYEVVSRVENDGFVDLTANQLRIFREPRLMAKMDHTKNLPHVFRENRFSILPITTDTYRVGPFRIYEPLADSEVSQTEVLSWPTNLESIQPGKFTSESTILHAALATNILKDFTQSELVSTTSGRMRSGKFNFMVDRFDSTTETIPVAGAQIEIDGGFEGERALYLFEAKAHGATDFNIRQLYYPFRTWHERIEKEIRPTYLTYENDEFTLYEYAFADATDFSSLSLVKCKRYALRTKKIMVQDLVQHAKASIGAKPLDGIPFPQADSFERVVDLVEVALDHECTIADLTDYYRFDKRQSSYYLEAAVYLGLLEKSRNELGISVWQPTALALTIFQSDSLTRNAELAKLVVSRDSFARVFVEAAANRGKLSRDSVVNLIESSHDLSAYGGSTIPRRASTVRSWIEWAWHTCEDGS